MTWLKLALIFLQLADKIADYARANQLISAGEDKQIAQSSLAILKKTQAAKEIDEQVAKMDDAAVLSALAKSGNLRPD